LRKSASEIFVGTLKTVFGFLILQAGTGVIVNALTPFSTMFTQAFHLTGIVAEDNSLVAAVQTFLGYETAFILVFSFIINVILARITKYKYIFLTGHMMFSFAGTMAIVLDQMGINGWKAILIGSIVQGISMVLFPAISQASVRIVTGSDNVAFGFWGSSWISLCGWIGGKLGDKTKSTEEINVSKNFGFLKDMSVLMGIVMLAVYLITAFFVNPKDMVKITGGQNTYLFAIIQALTFVAGILVLLQGVRMFLGEIIPAFKGISEKIVPGAKPALDVPIFYPYAPTGVTIGFIATLIGSLIVTFLSKWLPVAVLPSVIGLFFMGGAVGVFGNARGGRRGAILGGLIFGITWTLLIAFSYPLIDVSKYRITGLWFASPDAIIVAVLMRLVGKVFGL
jgi:PTS system sugar-specific permease component.